MKFALLCVPVPAAPVTLMDTNAARVLVLVPGTYLTVIVQVPLVANVVPLVQVPPVMENVPPPLVVLVMVGAAVNCVEAPVVFVTVMLAFLVLGVPGRGRHCRARSRERHRNGCSAQACNVFHARTTGIQQRNR